MLGSPKFLGGSRAHSTFAISVELVSCLSLHACLPDCSVQVVLLQLVCCFTPFIPKPTLLNCLLCCLAQSVPSRRGVGGVITPGPGPRRGLQKRYIIYYNNYRKLTAGAQQNLGKLLISGILSGPGLVLVVII